MRKRKMTVGDWVKYTNMETGEVTLGFINDIMEFEDGSFPMYEVVCTEPYDIGWYTDISLKALNED